MGLRSILKQPRYTALAVTFALGVVLFFVSFYVDSLSSVVISDRKLQALEKAIHKKQRQLATLANKWLDCMDANPQQPFSSDPDFSQLEAASDIMLFGFSEHTLLYWSANAPITVERLLEVDTLAHYISTGSSWHGEQDDSDSEGAYIAQAYQRGSYRVVSLILIRNDYTYENSFLKNAYNPHLPFPASTFVAPLGEGGYVVSGVDGRPLFAIGVDVLAKHPNLSYILRWFGFVLLLAALSIAVATNTSRRRPLLPLGLYVAAMVLLRAYLMYHPGMLTGSGMLFSPLLFAASDTLPSLGDLLLNVLFAFFISVVLYSYRSKLASCFAKLPKAANLLLAFVSAVVLAAVGAGMHHSLCSLIVNSNIPLEPYRLSSISFYSGISYGVIAMAMAAFFFLQLCYLQLFRQLHWLLPPAMAGLVLGLFAWLFLEKDVCTIIFVLFYLGTTALSTYHLRRKQPKLFYQIALVLLASLYFLLVVIIVSDEKEKNERIVTALNLSAERDPVAELLFKDIGDRISSDSFIADLIRKDPVANRETIKARLLDTYFNGYLKRYEVNIIICPKSVMLQLIEQEVDCWEFFEQERERYEGATIGHFSFLNTNNGRISYLASFKYPSEMYNGGVGLFIELNSKFDRQQIGYPELLIEQSEDVAKPSPTRSYSYAKYHNGVLVSYYGSYDYGFELRNADELEVGQYVFYQSNGYSHLQVRTDEQNAVIVSLPELRLIDYLLSFSYVFLFFFFAIVLLMSLGGFSIPRPQRRITFRQRITVMLLTILTLSFGAIGASMLVYNMRQFEKSNITDIEDRMKMLMFEFERRYYNSPTFINGPYEELGSWLVDLSNIYYTDINLYTPSGELLASSRPEIFTRGLQGERINPKAFRILRYGNLSHYVDKETIGSMTFYSAYAMYYNNDGLLLGFINLPYFAKQAELRGELTSLTIAVLNIFILLTVLGIFVAVAIANRLAKPLEAVREGMKRLDLEGRPEAIAYNGNDELGDLVREYNRVTKELADSAQRLAKTERESAWREMARQIAHEIKNPLTPMRLSIQHVMRMKNDGNPMWQERFDDLAKSLIEQIDTLADTASEFSSFAKLAETELHEVSLLPLLREQLTLFAGYENIAFELACDEPEVKVVAHREQLQRVFTNLIKNAVQAIGEKPDGRIRIAVAPMADGMYAVAVSDNGVGISEEQQRNLFRPNFTTKSGGTGLGLAISKNIVESFGGSISFSPSESGGACFTVHLKAAG